MGSRGREDLWQGGSWRTQRDGGLWKGAGQAAAGRPHKVVGMAGVGGGELSADNCN